MSEAEFAAWTEFYKLYPFDDRNRYHRPASLIAAMSVTPDGRQEAFVSNLELLSPDPSVEIMSDADMATMRAFGFDRKEG